MPKHKAGELEDTRLTSLSDASKEKYNARYEEFEAFIKESRRTRAAHPKPTEEDFTGYLKMLKEEKQYGHKTIWSAPSMLCKIAQARWDFSPKDNWPSLTDQCKGYEKQIKQFTVA